MESVVTGLSFNRPDSPLTFIENCVSQIRHERKVNNQTKNLQWDMFVPLNFRDTFVSKEEYKNQVKFRGRIGEFSRSNKVALLDNRTQQKNLAGGFPKRNHGGTARVLAGLRPFGQRPFTRQNVLPPILQQAQQLSPQSKNEIFVGGAFENVVFVLGGPGSGKGTQCERLAKEFDYNHISCGDLLRAEVATDSDRAKFLQNLMKEGKIVPLDITLQLLKEAMMMAPKKAKGFLIDGFPRQLDQAKAFEATVAKCKFVLYFECPPEVLVERLLKRGETSGRADDNLETIKKRFDTFKNTSFPVIEEYSKIGKTVKISSISSPNEVYATAREYFVDPKSRGLAWSNIIFVLGGPGCGKGTQCTRLAKEFEYNHISCGDLLRAEVETGSERAIMLQSLMKDGLIVPIDVTLELLREAMLKCSPEKKGFLIDGFPRQVDQARAFEATISPCKFVLYFECPEDVLLDRLLKRGETSGRADDNIETIKKRFHTFNTTSFPVVEEYSRVGKTVKILSTTTPDDVYMKSREYFIDPYSRGKAWKNIIFVLGGPGSGKGTQCERLANEFNYTHISCGDLLRAEVATGSVRAEMLQALMKEGQIVPIDVTLELLREAMHKTPKSSKGFLIDGFPRQIDQAHAFESTIAPCKFVLYFECPEVVLQERLLKRGETSGRSDDNIDTIKKRFSTFINSSYPVIERYGEFGKTVKISSIPSADEVYNAAREYFIDPRSRGLAWKNIVFVLGGPGSGKGTQCEKLSKEFEYRHISCGDLLRAEVETGSERAQLLQNLMKEGKIVPIEVTLELLREAMLRTPKTFKGFLIDGFPRQVDQAHAFEATIAPCKFVLYFDCPESTLQERLLKRGETSGRADDNLETIKKRFSTFFYTSYPVISEYSAIGKCVKISSIPSQIEVYEKAREYFIDPVSRGESWKKIVFVLGGPGCGKGTQCEKLAKEFDYQHISCGDLLRAEVATGSERAQALQNLMKDGKIVPIEITLELLREAMLKCPKSKKGFLIDGFPRQVDQAHAFEATIAPCKFVLYFECPKEVLQERLLKRAETSGRADDNLETIKKRFDTFINTSYPVIEEYEEIGKCVKISSTPSPQEVYCTAKEYFLEPETRGVAWKNIIFVLGGPGCGKGTQCEKLAEEFEYKHISCGDLLRAEVTTGSERAQLLQSLMKDGKIVPINVTLELLREEMLRTTSNFKGFLIDGFPRQIDQAFAFEAVVASCRFVLYFECPESVLESRLLKRGETSGRADDNLETIKKRFSTFINTSYEVIQEYERIGKLVKISSIPSPAEVYQACKEHFTSIKWGMEQLQTKKTSASSRPESQHESSRIRTITGESLQEKSRPSSQSGTVTKDSFSRPRTSKVKDGEVNYTLNETNDRPKTAHSEINDFHNQELVRDDSSARINLTSATSRSQMKTPEKDLLKSTNAQDREEVCNEAAVELTMGEREDIRKITSQGRDTPTPTSRPKTRESVGIKKSDSRPKTREALNNIDNPRLVSGEAHNLES
ncbi:hypothetical protein HK099_003668 [Clydaea vesicula]|uniref:adenylate kinase n=1 Tax=Clydaea vesicula TaxID=447962 RepID=A0AAD5U5Z2_9FUNG|nr:hypothetical protein HK099_003668 [Clydaea vesicula]